MSIPRFRWVMVALFVVIGLAVACDPDPTPTPTPSPTPTTVPPVSTAQTEATLTDFVVTESTTGQDLMDALSDEETSCIQAALGDSAYQIMLGVPLMTAGGNAETAAPLFNCLEDETFVQISVAFLGAYAGWEEETLDCMVYVGIERPDALRSGMGLAPPDQDAAAAAEVQPYVVQLYHCMSLREQVAYLLRLQEVVDALTTAEHDLIGAIPEADAVCIRDALTDAEYAMVLAGTVQDAFNVSDAVTGCMSEDGYAQSFVMMAETTIGGLDDVTRSCLGELARVHTHYVALINADAFDPATEDPEILHAVAVNGIQSWECMNEVEIQRFQRLSAQALLR